MNNFELRAGQSEVLNLLRNKESVFAALPTGYGKSLTYFLPASTWGWRVWVVSPLNSLIMDQAMAARSFGIKAVLWNWQGFSSRSENEESLLTGRYQMAYFSPERFATLVTKNLIGNLEQGSVLPDLLVLDELHCFENWKVFRSSYVEILPTLRKLSENIPVLGLSATLSESDGMQWLAEVGKSAKTVSVGLGRKNLRICISPQVSDDSFWLDLVERLKIIEKNESCIIYCGERFEAESVAQFLRSLGLSAHPFHAGRPLNYKNELTQKFREGKISVLCATSAFGMGIDYPRVRKVIHLSPPPNISSLWQEAGRAGRDGKPAEAILYFRRSDVSDANRISKLKERMDYYFVWALLWRNACRKVVIGEFLGMQEKSCEVCDWCTRKKDLNREIPWWSQETSRLKYWVKKKIFFQTKKS